MSDLTISGARDLVASVLALWRDGYDTARIAARTGLAESVIYNLLARLFDGVD